MAYELLYGERPFEKHCPHTHISYLEDALKKTIKLKKKASDAIRRRSLDESMVNFDYENSSSPSRDSPFTTTASQIEANTKTGCSTTNMTTGRLRIGLGLELVLTLTPNHNP
jgi:hypothetical protein